MKQIGNRQNVFFMKFRGWKKHAGQQRVSKNNKKQAKHQEIYSKKDS